SLLAADPDVFALGLGLDALTAEIFDEPVDFSSLVRGDPGDDACPLSYRSTRSRFDRAVVDCLEGNLAAYQPFFENLAERRQPVLGDGRHRDLAIAELDR